MFNIMIVEDDSIIYEGLKNLLEKWNYSVVSPKNFKKIMDCVLNESLHAVILDINLPVYDGYYWCRRIREVSKIPIIFISSRDCNMDIIMAINIGGDEYIQKPFNNDIVIAKINGIMRRTYDYVNNDLNILKLNDAILYIDKSKFEFRNKKVDLTKNELKILNILMKSGDKIVSRDSIMRYLWEDESFIDDSTLTVNINRLRKKLKSIGLKDFIKTKKGQGYTLI